MVLVNVFLITFSTNATFKGHKSFYFDEQNPTDTIRGKKKTTVTNRVISSAKQQPAHNKEQLSNTSY